VIYWQFENLRPPRSLQIGETFAASTGYTLSDVPYAAAFAGYKDWFILAYNRPGYTIEVGIGRNPIPISQFDTIYRENEEVMLLAPII
jgi:g-D-glutamyl-meso-diaminopimelate peptidase